MDLIDLIRRRRMVRSFSGDPIESGVVGELLAQALRAPTAGHTRGTAWLTLEGAEQTSIYWRHTTTEAWRRSAARWPGLSRAPVALLSLASPAAYVARYGEPDKASSGLGPPASGGGGAAAWPVPYWFGDAAFSTLLVLLGAEDRGLGAAFLGNFRGEVPLLAELGVPDGWRLFGAVLLGRPGGDNHRSASLERPGPSTGQRIHRGRWCGSP